MPKRLILLAASVCLCGPLPLAAAHECAKQETADALAKQDKDIAVREGNITEMRDEITQSGGSTDEQKKALRTFEGRLDQVKQKRAALLAECAEKSAP